MGDTNNKKSGSSAAMVALLLLLGVILLISAAAMKEEYKYYWDESYKNGADFINIVGWGSLIGAVILMFLPSGDSNKAELQASSTYKVSSEPSPKSTYAEGMYYLGEPKTMDNLLTAYRCFIKIPDYEDAKWKALECRRMIEAMEAEEEQLTLQKRKLTESEGRTCTACNRPLLKGQVFCGYCGERQKEQIEPKERKCAACNQPLVEGQVFCGYCGKKQV